MSTTPTTSAATTRRELLTRKQPTTDATRLARLLALEQMTVDAYSLAIETAPLSLPTLDAARAILAQEQLHVEALQRLVPKPAEAEEASAPEGAAEVLTDASLQHELARAGIHVRMRRIRSEHQWIELLERIEGALAGAHFRAVRELTDIPASGVAAAILADEAQHATVLARLRHPRDVMRAVPYSVVPGDASLEL